MEKWNLTGRAGDQARGPVWPSGSRLRRASTALSPDASTASGSDDGSAWCLGTSPYGDGDLGTPGAANSPC